MQRIQRLLVPDTQGMAGDTMCPLLRDGVFFLIMDGSVSSRPYDWVTTFIFKSQTIKQAFADGLGRDGGGHIGIH